MHIKPSEHSTAKQESLALGQRFAQDSGESGTQTKTPRKRPKKADARTLRGEATRELILHTTERLICDHGIDGLSMRQIGVAVGQGNHSVIQYHFDSKEGLIRAIIGRRAEQFLPVREKLLADAKAAGKTGDVSPLLAVLLFPITTVRDETGRHVYAGFMLRALRTMWDQNAGILHQAWTEPGPVLETMQYLQALRPELSQWQLAQRVLRLNRFFVSALVDQDKIKAIGGQCPDEDYLLQDLLNMMTAAFMAPLPDPTPKTKTTG